MQGCVNVLQEKAYRFTPGGAEEIPIPDNLKGQVEEMQASLMETAAENDEVLLDKYFEDGSLSREDTIHGIRLGIASVNTIPVMAGSALQNRGVINLLNEIVTYMPQANERVNTLATDLAADKVVNILPEEDEPLAAQVFKTVIDPYSGKLSYLKVFRGKLKSGSTVWNANAEKEERIGQIYLLKGKKTEPVSELAAGDIGAVNKLSVTSTCDTLCDPAAKVRFDPIRFPKPTLFMAVSAEKKGEEDKVFAGLNKLAEEDYTFSVEKNAETGEILIGGQGDTQLEILARKVKARYGVDVKLSEPKIAYRETIRSTAEAEGKYKKQTGGHGQYGHCKIRFEPCEEPFVFEEEVVGGAVPKQYFPAVEKGLRGKPLLRPHRRLSRHGREGGAVRRQLSRSGQLGNGVQSGGGARLQRGAEKRLPRPARTRLPPENRRSRRLSRRRHGRHQQAPRQDHGHLHGGRTHRRHGGSPAGGNQDVHHRTPLPHARAAADSSPNSSITRKCRIDIRIGSSRRRWRRRKTDFSPKATRGC